MKKGNVFIFPSTFYCKLSRVPNKNTLQEIQERKPSPRSKLHSRVRSWTTAIDLFSKDMLILPICENSHWFVLVMMWPKLLVQSHESCKDKVPFLLLMDSYGLQQKNAVNKFLIYLGEELKVRHGDGVAANLKVDR